MSDRPFHELNQIAQYAEHIRWIVDTYPLSEKVETKLMLTAQVLDGEAKTFDALEAKLSKMEDALEHCGYDATDCIDCGGPPHNEWCRFWKLRDIVPILFASQEEADLDKLTTQQKPTEEAMEEA